MQRDEYRDRLKIEETSSFLNIVLLLQRYPHQITVDFFLSLNSHFLGERFTVLVDRDLSYPDISRDAKSKGRCHDD